MTGTCSRDAVDLRIYLEAKTSRSISFWWVQPQAAKYLTLKALTTIKVQSCAGKLQTPLKVRKSKL
jgi:hypothetical protein